MRLRTVLLPCLCACLGTSSARAEDNSLHGFGSRLRTLGDIDGDGVADFVIGSRAVNPKLLAVSGKKGTRLWHQYGYDAVSVADRNGDGHRDVLVVRGATAVGPNVKQIWGWFCDGYTGIKIDDYPAIAGGTPDEAAELGDVDGDGKEDFLFTRFGWPGDDQWCADVELTVRSITGPLLATIGEDKPFLRALAIDTHFRHFVAGPVGDLDGDGRTDLAVSCVPERGFESFEIRSAKNAVVTRFKSGATPYRPAAIAPIPDVDGDGTPDLLVGRTLVQEGTKQFAGEVRLLSGKDGKTLRTVRGAGSGHELGTSVVAMADVDGDGVPDFAAGAPGADRGKDRSTGAVYAYSGKTGRSLWVAKGDKDRWGLGTSLCALGDMDGDGVPDIAAGSLEFLTTKGYVVVLSGKTGKEIRRYEE